MENKDVRTHPRRELEFEVEYSIISGIGGLKLIQSRTIDFSVSGACIETREQLNNKDRLSVRIEVPDLNAFEINGKGKKIYQKTVIMCYGTVRWVKPLDNGNFSAGIRFSGISVSNFAYLKRLIEEKSLNDKE
jgi:hypothetical protein